MSRTPRVRRLATWNVGWASGKRQSLVRERIAALDADVIAVTEGTAAALPDEYTIVTGEADWGYREQPPDRRKVILASRLSMSDVVTTGPRGMPSGRIVSATIGDGDQALRVHAVCIPWSHAHVSTGRRDATAWSQHEAYLRGLGEILKNDDPGLPRIVMGDFNQRIPRSRQPKRMNDLLLECLGELRIATSGVLPGLAAPGVNHIAVSPGIEIDDVEGIGRRGPDGRLLSDHDGVVATAAY
jgi:endonuclease/exonuclease/phosphatase family metal-dependent hydrolase